MIDRARLVALLADTLVPPVEGGGTPETAAFLRRSATDLGVVPHVLGAIGPAHEDVLRRLNALGFEDLDLDARTALLRKLASEPETSQPLSRAQGGRDGALLRAAGRRRREPELAGAGLSGPAHGPAVARPGPEDDRGRAPRRPGGGARGGRLRRRLGCGRRGRSRPSCRRPASGCSCSSAAATATSPTSNSSSSSGARELYLRGGLFWSESGSIGLLAGATLGGGTVDQLARLPPATRRDPRAVGRAGARRRGRRRVRRPPERRLARGSA